MNAKPQPAGAASDAPPRAAPGEPHWVALRMSKRGPGEFSPRMLFMHPSPDLAEAECRRLAAAQPGKRFAVYASVSSFKEEGPKAPAEQQPQEAAQP